MGTHRAPAPTHPPHLWLALMGAACAGILLPPVVIAAQAVAPRPVAERLSLAPERAAEPMGHGGLGGALSVPTVGVVAEETSGGLPPIVRTTQTVGSAIVPSNSYRAPRTVPGTQGHAEPPASTSTEPRPTAVAPNPTTTLTPASIEETTTWPVASADAGGWDWRRRTARSATSSSPPSATSTVTDPEDTASTLPPSVTEPESSSSSPTQGPTG